MRYIINAVVAPTSRFEGEFNFVGCAFKIIMKLYYLGMKA
jgi:hypothetical protein